MRKFYIVTAIVLLVVLLGFLVKPAFNSENTVPLNTSPRQGNSLYAGGNNFKGHNLNKKRVDSSQDNRSAIEMWEDQLRAEGIPVTIEEILPQTHGQSDAGPLLQKAFKLMENSPTIQELCREDSQLTLEERAKLFQHPDVVKLMEILAEASTKGKADFNLNYKSGFSALLPPMSSLRKITDLCSQKALVEFKQGNSQAAVDYLYQGLKVMFIGNDSMSAVSNIIENTAIAGLMKNMAEMSLSTEQTGRLYDLFEKRYERIVKDQQRAVDFVNFSLKKLTQQLLLDPSIGREWFGKDKIEHLKNPSLVEENFFLQSRLLVKWRRELANPLFPSQEKIEEITEEMRNSSAVLLDTYYLGFHTDVANYHSLRARLKMGMISLKINDYRQEHGHFPSSLNELGLPEEFRTDNFSGSPFIYTPTEYGALIKSVYKKAAKPLEVKIRK